MRFILVLILSAIPFTSFAELDIGKNFSGNSNQPINISADNLEVLQKDSIATFSGNVEAVQGTLNLKSDKMTVYYSKKNKSKNANGNAISKIDVDGNVLLYSPTETAKSEKGVYDVENNLVKLTGSVILTRGKNVLKGNSLVYNIVTGKSQLMSDRESKDGKSKGRVQGLFVPDKSGKNKN